MKILYQVVFGLLAMSNFAKSDFRQDGVTAMNKIRAKHHVPDLIENRTIDLYAQRWALEIAKNDNFSRRGNKVSKYGENMFTTDDTKISYTEVVMMAIDNWYSQEPNFDYNNPEKPKGFVRDFTQMVWKNSKNVGIGVARSSSATYVCSSYDPPGNLRESYPGNVLKP